MMSIYRAFFTLLYSPSRGLHTLQHQALSLRGITAFLISVGFLRGILDIPWIYWQAGRLNLLIPSLLEPAWYLLNIGPFILTEIVTALLRWLLFSTLVYGLGSVLLGGSGTFRATLNVYGVLLGITLVTILIDYLHLFLPLPLIRFTVSPRYNPIIGIGQGATSLWIGLVTYLFVRQAYGLAPWPAFLIGIFIPLWNTGMFLIAARVLFWVLPAGIQQNVLMIAFNIGFVLIGLTAFAVLFWWSRRKLSL